MSICKICKKEERYISSYIKVCRDCLLSSKIEEDYIKELHYRSRKEFGLIYPPPQESSEDTLTCSLCSHNCKIKDKGFCGLRWKKDGNLKGEVRLEYYYDPLPTNCVADWVCPGGVGAGYPKYALFPHAEYGYKNLAVFYCSCTFNCLFCQNWSFKTNRGKNIPARKLATAVDDKTTCICYFGGDPACNMHHAIVTSKLARNSKRSLPLRICWETNGTIATQFLDILAELSLSSGGCIKFDLKAYTKKLHLALCGVDNSATLANFEYLAKNYLALRDEPPLLIASTLLVPGYINAEEVYKIAKFIASLSVSIPYALLAFAPHFLMSDLPCTSREEAYAAYSAAKDAGLERIRIGNLHLLSS